MRLSDRRLAQRFNLSVPLSFRGWRSAGLERSAASVNVSESGVYFETDAPPGEGAYVQIKIAMPSEITGHAPTQWSCMGRVVRVQAVPCEGAPSGVAVRFSYYEIADACREDSLFAGRNS